MSSNTHRMGSISDMIVHHNDTISPASPRSHGDINLTAQFSDEMAELCMSEDYSDVVFMVEGVRLPAHRVILAARSDYFRAMLYGGMAESKQAVIELKVPLDGFKILLRYIYSGHLSLYQLKEDTILDTLGLANQYGFDDLQEAISCFLHQILSLNNVCGILDAARLYTLDELTEVCYTYLDRNAPDILAHPSFKTLSKDTLEQILRRDSFFAPEVQIFVAVNEWCKFNSSFNAESVVSLVRLPLMTLEQLLSVVRNSGIINPDKLLDAITEKTDSCSLPYRGALWPEKNIACANFGASTIQGEWRSDLLNGDTTSYDMERGYTRHSITDSADAAIVVELGSISIINHIKILLWDRDSRSYSYYIETSVNQLHWDRVVDYTGYYCRSWQELYFPPKSARYIKLVGTHNTVNKVFHVVALEALYTASVPTLVNGVIQPKHNVARVEMGASVLEGVSRTRNALLNGDCSNYDWDTGYTCHQLGSGAILVRLAQPYCLSSMRLLLWDCDDRMYGFYIETSVNQKTWEMVVDRRHDLCRSWQSFSFSPRPVIFIKIIGTSNTANEIFHCVHFECPSQEAPIAKKVIVDADEMVDDESLNECECGSDSEMGANN